MPRPKPHDSSRPKPLGNHQGSWIWGRHLVQQTLQAKFWPVLELWLADDLPEPDVSSMTQLAQSANVPVQLAPRRSLVSRCRGEDHQGFAARMAEFPYASPDTVCRPTTRWPLVIVLDRVQDPYNFGTILRSGEIFGAQGVVIGTREQTGVTSQVARSSVGAVNCIPVAQVPALDQFLESPEVKDFAIVAASEKASTAISEFDFRRPTMLVIGNEARGISPEIAARCTSSVRIPQQGQLNSLNAAAALAIICYEIRRQQAVGMDR